MCSYYSCLSTPIWPGLSWHTWLYRWMPISSRFTRYRVGVSRYPAAQAGELVPIWDSFLLAQAKGGLSQKLALTSLNDHFTASRGFFWRWGLLNPKLCNLQDFLFLVSRFFRRRANQAFVGSELCLWISFRQYPSLCHSFYLWSFGVSFSFLSAWLQYFLQSYLNDCQTHSLFCPLFLICLILKVVSFFTW